MDEKMRVACLQCLSVACDRYLVDQSSAVKLILNFCKLSFWGCHNNQVCLPRGHLMDCCHEGSVFGVLDLPSCEVIVCTRSLLITSHNKIDSSKVSLVVT